MPQQGAQDRTEKATPKRRREAREQGTVARSQEVDSVIVLLAGVGVLYYAGSYFATSVSSFSITFFRKLPTWHLNTPQAIFPIILEIVVFMFKAAAPLMLAIMIAGIASNLFQVGFMISGKPLMPKLERIDPMSGFGRLFSKRSLAELIKSLLKIAVVSYVGYGVIRGAFADFVPLAGASVPQIAAFFCSVAFKLAFRCIGALVVIAGLDYFFQRWQHEKELMMTMQEVKEEMKHTEGNPQIKSRIRQIQQKMASARMMKKVPEADVVITNPTTFAVAVKYDPKKMKAPQVLAKGKLLVAQRIVAIAKEHKIPIVENVPVARALYKMVDIGKEVPENMYQAVAEILAYVYRLKNQYNRPQRSSR